MPPARSAASEGSRRFVPDCDGSRNLAQRASPRFFISTRKAFDVPIRTAMASHRCQDCCSDRDGDRHRPRAGIFHGNRAMRHISTAIAATLALATTALAVEIAHHRSGKAPERAVSVAPAPAADSEPMEIMEVWSDEQTPAPASPHSDIADADAKPADAKAPQASEAKPSSPDPRAAEAPAPKVPDAAEVKTLGANSEGPITEPGKAGPEAPAAARLSGGDADKPSAREKPRHAHRAAARRDGHHEAKWVGPKSLGRKSPDARSFGQNAFWRTGAHGYGFSGSFGGCVFRGSVNAAGYHIDRSC